MREPAAVPVDQVLIGMILGTFGLKGAVKIQSLTDFPERFDAGRTIFIGDTLHEIKESQWHNNHVRVWLMDIRHIQTAETLFGKQVYVPAADLPDLEEDEYMVRDLIGMEVVSEEGTALGVLEEIIPLPANDVYRVGETLIPAVKEFVLSVDLPARKITVRLIPEYGE